MKRFFIIGNPRSGTTLFRLMLNKHSELSVPPEAGFLSWLYQDFHDFSFTKKAVSTFMKALKKTKKIETWNFDFDGLQSYILLKKPNNYAVLSNCIYEYYSKVILNKDVQIFGDKNNFYLNEIELLSNLYPDSKFIHIIRDGRSVAVSYKDLHKKSINVDHAPVLPVDIEEIALSWKKNINTIEMSFEKLDSFRHLTIRFEDLIMNPINILTQVSDFLGVSYESNMLEYYLTTEKEGLEPKNFLKWKAKNLKPIQKDEITKYKQLNSNEIVAFENIASELLSQYKYITSDYK